MGHGYWPMTHVTHPDLLTHLTHDPWPTDSWPMWPRAIDYGSDVTYPDLLTHLTRGAWPTDPWPMWPIQLCWPIWPMTQDPLSHCQLWFLYSALWLCNHNNSIVNVNINISTHECIISSLEFTLLLIYFTFIWRGWQTEMMSVIAKIIFFDITCNLYLN